MPVAPVAEAWARVGLACSGTVGHDGRPAGQACQASRSFAAVGTRGAGDSDKIAAGHKAGPAGAGSGLAHATRFAEPRPACAASGLGTGFGRLVRTEPPRRPSSGHVREG